ncbi:hypothetical protein AAG747_01915 [Rapidithrix thailandica]|uniref:Uncharacterized protein n=1 Tax=Rapidithrix thailandica TaxID=413964 RepID=A0AAW9RPB6_9BACT
MKFLGADLPGTYHRPTPSSEYYPIEPAFSPAQEKKFVKRLGWGALGLLVIVIPLVVLI